MRLLLRITSICIGLIYLGAGFMFILDAAKSTFYASTGESNWTTYVIPGLFLLIIITYCTFVNYLMLVKFSGRSIKHFCILLALILCSLIVGWAACCPS